MNTPILARGARFAGGTRLTPSPLKPESLSEPSHPKLHGVTLAIIFIVVVSVALLVMSMAQARAAGEGCNGVQVSPGDNLTQVAAAHPAGTTYCIRDGDYSITAGIVVQSNDVFEGVYSDGSRPSVRTTTAEEIFAATGSTGATISGVTVSGAVGDTSCQPACGRGISGGTNLTLDNVRATENANQGVGGTGANLVIRNSVFDSNGTRAFYVDGTYASAAGVKSVNSMFIYNSRVTDNAWVGFWCDLECDAFEVHDSVASRNGKGGIFYEVSTGPAIFEGNTIRNNGYSETRRRPGGLLMVSSQNANAYGNTFGSNNEAGVRITDDERSPSVSKINVHDNTMNDDPVIGCAISGASCARNN
jgi:hypothetical protein